MRKTRRIVAVVVALALVLLYSRLGLRWRRERAENAHALLKPTESGLTVPLPVVLPEGGEEDELSEDGDGREDEESDEDDASKASSPLHPLNLESHENIRALAACLEKGTCQEKQKMVVLLISWHFYGWVSGSTTGEAVWCGSVLDTLRDLDYTLVFAPDTKEAARLHKMFPSLVKVVLGETLQGRECFADAECVKSASNPRGIPTWKFFQFHLWGGPTHPLGPQWTLAIEKEPPYGVPNQYLGYSLEPTCSKRPFVPHDERRHQAFVLGKRLSYWAPDRRIAHPAALLAATEAPLSLEFVGGLANDTGSNDIKAPYVLQDLGFLDKDQFLEEVGKSKVMVGIGSPLLSPSPFDALCEGVPFINPIKRWDHADPDNRTKWSTQHDGLKWLDPPYVYHYHRLNFDELYKALEQAVTNPIDRFIPYWMKYDKLKRRVQMLVESDWKTQAEWLLNERKQSGEELFTI